MAKEKDRQDGTDILSALDKIIGHDVSPARLFEGAHPKIEWKTRTNNAGFTIAQLTPGDAVWVENPDFNSATDEVGAEGSNDIYIGHHKFVGFNGTTFPNLGALQEYVRDYSHNVNQPLANFKIKRVFEPKVPSFFYVP